MAPHPTIRVDDDLASGDAGVPLRATDHEASGRVDVQRSEPLSHMSDGSTGSMTFSAIPSSSCSLPDVRVVLRGDDDGV